MASSGKLAVISHDEAAVDEERELQPQQQAEQGRIQLSEADDKRICRKTDGVILTILVWVYFLQILDKTVLAYGATYGLKVDTGLQGNQYSLVSAAGPIAQLLWQPMSSYLIVRVPHRTLMTGLVLGWGIAQSASAACHDFSGLMAARFFLGLFEAGCLPLFGIITSQWYRRAEQPLRIAAWYGTNGLATIFASVLSFGLGQIRSSVLRPWQIIFLFVGLMTVITAPFVFYRLDNDIPSARFLNEDEKLMAMERLRSNQSGTVSRAFEPGQAIEAAREPKTYLWIAMTLLLNVGASVTNTFGPIILDGLVSNHDFTSLLNIPFGALQFIFILLASFLSQKARLKGAVLVVFMMPVVAGLAVLLAVRRGAAASSQGALLTGYYLLAFIFGGNPLMVTWIIGNTAGTTKQSIVMALYNASSAAGNIIGPLLFNDKDAPAYKPGLRACLAIFVALVLVLLLQWTNLVMLNKKQETKRLRNGKSARLVDYSMQQRFEHVEIRTREDVSRSNLTDGENDEFIYIY
ncbi:hypothetical protein L249_0167 [Ophiocordyceps polyrhachis-furcata BCC 54312]|uniref:Major facilitator superfamily (MFS) profile domain-containing protein n=1 Tax=Ophiocordyceps polyrhachis-furcata BCC 54312 TaxID=1330021 RepID=A0A367LDX2_9HYPO|nr:hypothetical protein L249_0167 [Ophiocordyceps polyrhachis-furcata BCC 54312]